MSGSSPLFHAAWLFAVGIAVTHWLWLPPSFLLLAVVAMALLCALAAFLAQRVIWLPMAALWCLLGAWCALMEPRPVASPSIDAASDGLLRTVEGTISDAAPMRAETERNVNENEFFATNEPAAVEQPSQRIDVDLASAEFVSDTEDLQKPAAGRVRLTVRWPEGEPAPFRCGERIRATVRLLRPESYRDPGAWSRADYLLDKGITSTATVKNNFVERLGVAPGAASGCLIVSLQHNAATQLMTLPAHMRSLPGWMRLSDDDAIMLSAMVAGDRTFLTHSLRIAFERTGSFHMLVVAGFHLAILSACIFWLTRRLRIPRVPATLLTIAASFAYALFTGFALPVQRACWMVSLYLIGRLIYRERSAMNALGFAALCMLMLSPRSLFDASLQMTLLAVLAIAGVAAPLLNQTVQPYMQALRAPGLQAIDVKLNPYIAEFRVTLRMFSERLRPLLGRWPSWRVMPWCIRMVLRTVELAIVSVLVELAMTLPMAIYFHRITLFALPVNMIMLPMLFALLPAALVTLLALSFWPAIAVVPGAVTAVVLHGGVGLVHLFGAMQWSDLRIPDPALMQKFVFYAALGVAVLLARWGLRRRNLWLPAAACLSMLLAALASVAPRPIVHPHDALLVEVIDVGQGDALLAITPDGKTLLVDSGGFGGGPRQAPQEFDIGEEVVAPALWARGIRRLDVAALSHAHSDHMGGMSAILHDFRPAEFWVGNNPSVAPYEALLREAAALGVRVRRLRAGDHLPLGSGRVNVLAPLPGYLPGAEPGNNDSLVFRLEQGGASALFEGDAEAPIEEGMLAEPELQSTLLKVGHHGSKTSSTQEFIARVAPRWASVSCGRHNRYGHPAMQTLQDLQAAHVRTLSTDTAGALCFLLKGNEVRLDPECSGKE